MKKASRIALGALGILLFSCSAALAYWAIAPELTGPKSNIGQVCATITPGMDSAGLNAVLKQNPALQITPLQAGKQYVSQVKAGWLCSCSLQIADDGRVSQVNNVTCAD